MDNNNTPEQLSQDQQEPQEPQQGTNIEPSTSSAVTDTPSALLSPSSQIAASTDNIEEVSTNDANTISEDSNTPGENQPPQPIRLSFNDLFHDLPRATIPRFEGVTPPESEIDEDENRGPINDDNDDEILIFGGQNNNPGTGSFEEWLDTVANSTSPIIPSAHDDFDIEDEQGTIGEASPSIETQFTSLGNANASSSVEQPPAPSNNADRLFANPSSNIDFFQSLMQENQTQTQGGGRQQALQAFVQSIQNRQPRVRETFIPGWTSDELASLPASVKKSASEYYERENLMTVRGQTRLEIGIAPPLEDILKVYLPEDQAIQLAETITAESKIAVDKAAELTQELKDKFGFSDDDLSTLKRFELKELEDNLSDTTKYKVEEEKKSTVVGLINTLKDHESIGEHDKKISAVLTRSLLTPEFKSNTKAFKQRWVKVLEVMGKHKENRDKMLSAVHNFLGNCVEPMLNALNTMEGFVKDYERRLVQHDPVSIIAHTKAASAEDYKRNMLALMAQMLAPVVSEREFTETYSELEVHIGNALQMQSAASVMKYSQTIIN